MESLTSNHHPFLVIFIEKSIRTFPFELKIFLALLLIDSAKREQHSIIVLNVHQLLLRKRTKNVLNLREVSSDIPIKGPLLLGGQDSNL